MVPTSASGSSSQGIASGGPGLPGVSIVAGGAPINSGNSTPTTARARGESNGEEQEPPVADDSIRTGVRAAMERVTDVVSRLMVLLKALRGKSGSPFPEFWKALIRNLIRAPAPAANAGGIQVLPPIRRGEAGAGAAAIPAMAPGDLWDRGLDGLLSDRDRDRVAAGPGARGNSPAIADAYWAALLLSNAADEVRLRAANGRPTRKKARAWPGMTRFS
jgi:hypothetical protein